MGDEVLTVSRGLVFVLGAVGAVSGRAPGSKAEHVPGGGLQARDDDVGDFGTGGRIAELLVLLGRRRGGGRRAGDRRRRRRKKRRGRRGQRRRRKARQNETHWSLNMPTD